MQVPAQVGQVIPGPPRGKDCGSGYLVSTRPGTLPSSGLHASPQTYLPNPGTVPMSFPDKKRGRAMPLVLAQATLFGMEDTRPAVVFLALWLALTSRDG